MFVYEYNYKTQYLALANGVVVFEGSPIRYSKALPGINSIHVWFSDSQPALYEFLKSVLG